MEGIDDLEMNEFVKKNPSYAEDFYSQMSKKYTKEELTQNRLVFHIDISLPQHKLKDPSIIERINKGHEII